MQPSLPSLAFFFLLWVAGLLGHLGFLAPTASGRQGLPNCSKLPHQLLIEQHILGIRNMASEPDDALGSSLALYKLNVVVNTCNPSN